MLLASLFACVGVMQAQPEVGKEYRIKDDKTAKYLTIGSYNANSGGAQGTVPVIGKEDANVDQVWTLEVADETKGTYYLKSKSGYYLKCRGWNVDALNDGDKSPVSLEAPTVDYLTGLTIDGYAEGTSFCIKNGDKYFKTEEVGGTVHPFCNATPNDGWANRTTWTFEEVPSNEFGKILFSTNDYKFYYHIKNLRANKYASYDGDGAFSEVADANAGAYWYFVDATANLPEETEVPAGYLACYIFNAANGLAVQNHGNGYMNTVDAAQYPAKIYYIREHENTHKGYVIHNYSNQDEAWNDANRTAVTNYYHDDAGSIWDFELAELTKEQAVGYANATKNAAAAFIASAKEASYYTYAAAAIATAEEKVNALNTDNILNALSGSIAIEVALNTLKAAEKGTAAPVAGQYIQLKNRQYNKYLNANGDKLNGINDKNSLATLWYVEAGTENNVKLKNVSTGKYIGEIRMSADVAMVDAENAKEFTFTNQVDMYAVFHETTGDDYAYGHIAGHNVLVGWEAGAGASQWVVAQISTEPYELALSEALAYVNACDGNAVGQVVMDAEALAAAKATADAALAAEVKDIKALVDAENALYAVVEAGTPNLPVAGRYYQIKSANPDFFAKQGVEMAIYSNAADGLLSWKALDATDKTFYWTITPDGNGKFVFQNAGDSKFVPAVADDRYTMNENSENAVAFTLTWLTLNQFNFVDNGTIHMAGHGGGAGTSGRICSWDACINSASAWTIVEVENPDLAVAKAVLAAKVAELEAYVANATGAIGYYKAVATDELKAAIAEAEAVLDGGSSDAAVYEAAMVTLTAASEGLDMSIVLPETGKFYRIKNNAGNAYLNAGTTGRTQFAAGVNELASSIFYYDGKLLSYANGMYLANADGFLNYGETVGEGAEIAFEASKEFGKLQIKFGDNRYFHSNGEGQSNAGGNAGMTADGNYRFTLEEVTWLPVAMNATVGYATLYSPVQLALSYDRVKAYTAAREGNVLTLVEQTVVPANTGVILELQEGKEGDVQNGYVFLQVQDATVEVEGNALVGSFAKSVKNEEAKVYTLQKPAEKEVGFYLFKGQNAQGETTYINGFRAWVEVAEGEEAPAMFTLGRGGEEDEDTTGIDQLINNGEVVIYDLSGRRVEKMEKGIYIVNGKKVIK